MVDVTFTASSLYQCLRSQPTQRADPYGLDAGPTTSPTTQPSTTQPTIPAGFQGGLQQLQDACTADCPPTANNGGCTVAACQQEATAIFNAVVAAWNLYYGTGPLTGVDVCGGYFCWDWAQIFHDAVANTKPKCFKGAEKTAHEKPNPDRRGEVHYFLALWACPDNCTVEKRKKNQVSIDDGFLQDGNIHTGPFPDPDDKLWGGTAGPWDRPTKDRNFPGSNKQYIPPEQ